jgi:small conductance mechanosensitive channel
MSISANSPPILSLVANRMCRVLIFASMLSFLGSMAPAQDTAQTPQGAAAVALADAAVDESARDSETGVTSEVLNPAIDPTELDYRLVPMTKEELGALAAAWLKIVKGKTENVMAAQIAIRKTEGTVEDAVRASLGELVHTRKALFDKYSKVITAWEKKGGAPDAITEFRSYRNAVIIEETRAADFETLVAHTVAWLTDSEGGIQLAIDISVIIGALFALLFVARVFRRLASRWIAIVPNLSKLLQVFLVTVVYWIVLTVGLMVVLSALGIDVSPVFALIGGASFILAFAFQDTLGNLASGLMIMANRPFDEGDYVDVGGVAGTVKAVSIVATTVVTPDNQVIVIPNKNVWGNVIINVTASQTRRVDLVFGISYEDSIPLAQRVIEDAVKAHPLVLLDPAPVVRVNELADSSVNFICRPWTNTADYWNVYWDLMQQIKQAFDAAGISTPYPRRDIHLKATAGALGDEPPRPAPRQADTSQSGKAAAIAKGDDGGDALVQEA